MRSLKLAAALLLAACGDLPLLGGPPSREPAQLRLELAAADLLTGDSVPLRWAVYDAQGQPLDPLPPWAVPQWSDSGELLQLSGGRLEAIRSGETRLVLTLAGLQASAPLRINPASMNVSIPAVYLTQAVQRLDGSIPLVAGRDAWLRIFVAGDAANFFTPTVRAHFHRDGAPIAMLETRAGGGGVPVRLDEGAMAWSWNLPVPGALLLPGTSLLVEVLRDGGLRASASSTLTWPAGGTPVSLDIRSVAPFEITFVPIHIIGFATGDVTPQNVESYMAATRAVWPLAEVDVAVRSPYSTTTRSATADDWSDLLREIRTLRLLENTRRYYHGILRREGAWSGLAYVGYPVGITRDGNSTWTVAHELGHNFGRRHAPCGDPSGVDANYPHAGGGIGVFGLAMDGTTLHSPARADLMTYCSPRWVSDYNYLAAFAFRANEAATGGPRRNTVDVAEPVLVVSGVVGPRGLRLDPAFSTTARPVMPQRPGPYSVAGLDHAGVELFRISFDGEALGEGPDDVRHFAFAVPLHDATAARLTGLRLESGGRTALAESAVATAAAGRLRGATLDQAIHDVVVSARRGNGSIVQLDWDAELFPTVLVREPATGAIIGRLTGGSGTVMTPATELDLDLSDGVGSRSRRVSVTRP